MPDRPTHQLSHRDLRLLRAAADGRLECSGGLAPDCFVDGLPCCDHGAARALASAGLLRTDPSPTGRRVAVHLTAAGADLLAGPAALVAS
jgi:hypothetical protein